MFDIGQYIQEIEDEKKNNSHKESYIDQTIITPRNLPKNILGILNMLCDYDRIGAWWLYFDRLDDLQVNAKNAMAAGLMSKNDWNVIVDKYWKNADLVYNKEIKNELL